MLRQTMHIKREISLTRILNPGIIIHNGNFRLRPIFDRSQIKLISF